MKLRHYKGEVNKHDFEVWAKKYPFTALVMFGTKEDVKAYIKNKYNVKVTDDAWVEEYED